MKVSFSYLDQQFNEAVAEDIWRLIKPVVTSGDFTLGKPVADFERDYAAKCGVKHAIGVGNGTDAIALPLMAIGNHGDVICPAFTFFATVGAVVQAGDKPVLVDIGDDMNIDPVQMHDAITRNTKAIVPVAWGGRPPDLDAIHAVEGGVEVVGDYAQGLGSLWNGKPISSNFASAFSLHPLKLCNVWGDGGVICTDKNILANNLRRIRNHGMVDRDHIERWGVNSRLDTIQAVVGRYVLASLDERVAKRRGMAMWLHAHLMDVDEIRLIPEDKRATCNYYLYTIFAQDRDGLARHLQYRGIDCKVHYPVPLHLQLPAWVMGYKQGQFPKAEYAAAHTLSLPCHEYLNEDHAVYMVKAIKEFYTLASVV